VAALPRVLRQLRATLKPGGVLFSSKSAGHNEDGWNGERYGVYHDLDGWRAFMTAADFEELLVYYRPDGAAVRSTAVAKRVFGPGSAFRTAATC
jgi:hypothetical protein